MEKDFNKLAQELREFCGFGDNSLCDANVVVEEDNDGMMVTPKKTNVFQPAIYHFMEVAEFCHYHGLDVFISTRQNDILNPMKGSYPVIRIF